MVLEGLVWFGVFRSLLLTVVCVVFLFLFGF